MFYFMFLIDATKHNVEKKFKTFLLRNCLGEESRDCFVSFCVSFTGGNKIVIQKKRENILFMAKF